MRALFLLFSVMLVATGCARFHDESAKELRDAMGIEVTPVHLIEGEAPKISYAAEEIMARAEGHYEMRQFAEAVDEYGRFLELHATHPWAPYALHQKGMSWAQQFRSADRDPTIPFQARRNFEALLSNYPGSPPESKAMEWRAWADNQLAAHDLHIARFYLKTGRTEAALSRLNEMLAEYPESDTAAEARYDLGRALIAAGRTDDGADTLRAFLASGVGTKKQQKKAREALAGLGEAPTAADDED
ncbi:MAG: outer membrane protein assembly factor BamD [Nitrospirota bacterium]|nr:outer membrane protein assembly factor BamD [Nitrospirota bacterium]